MAEISILTQAIESVIQGSSPKPAPDRVVQVLLEAEREFRQKKPIYPLDSLLGSWRLCFITGTRKTRQRAGIVLGAGRYIPPLIQISLTYDLPTSEISSESSGYSGSQSSPVEERVEAGQVYNQVGLGSLKLKLTGPTKLLKQKPIMAFDFTHLIVSLLGIQIIDRDIRGGSTAAQRFYQERIGKQAFFAYFLVAEQVIAARGRGGGLALWGRLS